MIKKSNMKLRPFYIFSLPRSGSTFLQRLLASDENIATVSEPWLMLPFLYSYRKLGVYSEYGHGRMAEALLDFCGTLPLGIEDYRRELKHFALNLYEKSAIRKKDARYFMDKTPRYHLVAQELIEIFPDGKFVFLWRNPVAIAASIIETFGKGNWVLYAYKVDLFKGLINLIEAYNKYSEIVCSIRYEDLLKNPNHELDKLCNYLDIPFNQEILNNFSSVKLNGRMGDPTGVKNYYSVNSDPLFKWTKTINNVLRKKWCKQYVKWIGDERLSIIGYDLNTLIDEINSAPDSMNHIISDFFRICYGVTDNLLDIKLSMDKIKKINNWENVISNR